MNWISELTESYNGCITLLAFLITFFDQKKAAVPV